MELINRYIYAVTKNFPSSQRKEIELELKSNIDDMIEENQSSESYEEKVEKVLLELGDPEILADNYRGTKNYVIGPKYYHLYKLILKIVILAVVGGISIALLIESIFTTNIGMVDITTNYISAIFSGALQAFAWTTIIFMIIERKNINIDEELSTKNNWNLAKLPKIPDKKTVIPISKPIASIVFTTIFFTIFIALIYTAPEVFAAYFHNGKELVTIPLFNIAVLQDYRALIIGIFILSILKEVLNIYYRKWTLKHSIIHIAITILALVLTIIIFTDNNLWNPDFSNELLKHMKVSLDFPEFWINIKNWVLTIVVVANIIEIIGVLYKGLLYFRKEKI